MNAAAVAVLAVVLISAVFSEVPTKQEHALHPDAEKLLTQVNEFEQTLLSVEHGAFDAQGKKDALAVLRGQQKKIDDEFTRICNTLQREIAQLAKDSQELSRKVQASRTMARMAAKQGSSVQHERMLEINTERLESTNNKWQSSLEAAKFCERAGVVFGPLPGRLDVAEHGYQDEL